MEEVKNNSENGVENENNKIEKTASIPNFVIEISDPKLNRESNATSENTLNEIDLDIVNNKKNNIEKEVNINEPKKKSKRLYWADCARIFSTVCIIFLHSTGNACEKTLLKRNDLNWIFVCCYNCFTRFGVPMFVLLSGTFILDPSKKFSFKKLFRHNILRLATAFTFWSTINALLNIYVYKKKQPKDFFKLFFVGEEYLWFIFMIIGCYLISPFLRLFSDDMVLSRYFLGLCVFWGSFIPTLTNIFNVYKLTDAKDELNTWVNRWHYHFTLEFIGYYVAGYHIVKHVNIKSVKIRVTLYLLGLMDLVLFTYLTYRQELKNKKRYSKEFRDNYTLTVAFYTIVLFIFFKHEIGRIEFSKRAIKYISKLSSLTFGMYLVHMILKIVLSKYAHIKQEEFLGVKLSAKIGCPIFAITITILSLLISYLLSITPVLKNYVL
ncbi:hypothetical protein BCR36DRAFT_416131 [Piromyces finnis]|uniref:Acyltransferase 3 domain-containing protein n=1 Tax=Piromyces finnis TaxID=1754191 RepID=A0A1Y1UWF6_9FUNG|nr:hypothetical protein BCR36DRAFT_416131 [Piromyces finnis]|eukprot:ORX42384.1 hypothetical protein BCR36DRAFT_416131 [Piromyces finnis]